MYLLSANGGFDSRIDLGRYVSIMKWESQH